MSDISISSNSTTAVPPTPGDFGQDDSAFQSLTGDSLLAYCQTRMQNLDGDIQAKMGDQKADLARRQAIQSAEEVLKKYGDAGPQNQTQWDDCENAIKSAEAQLPPNDPARTQLETFRTKLEGQYCKDIAPDPHYPHDGEWKGNVDGLSQMEDNIKSGSEIQMLQLQELMSQRQTAVQLTTNMMSKMDQGQDSIVKNV